MASRVNPYPVATWTQRARAALYAVHGTMVIPGTTLFDAHRFYNLDNYLSRRSLREYLKVTP